ncbi:MAG TPA: hypothetical protein VMW80_01835 [Candidatus Dormibacteraeota bacterium]|nr:hypothetical protein [Candidatus Dormibacteraeota bacterium]
MTVREARTSTSTRDRQRRALVVRRPGERCDFCGSLTTTAAVAAATESAGTVICSRCVDTAAQQVFQPGGGDAA